MCAAANDTETRCVELEAAILQNNGIIKRQAQEIVWAIAIRVAFH